MVNDKEIKDFIQTHYPAVSGNEDMMADILKKISIIEEAKSVYRKESRTTDRHFIFTFIIGVLFGTSAVLTCIFCKPFMSVGAPSFINRIFGFVFQGRFFIMSLDISALGLIVYKLIAEREIARIQSRHQD